MHFHCHLSTINALRVLLTESPASAHDQYSSESVLALRRAAIRFIG